MGNYKFRLSDMIPNAWFYKLRDMTKTRTRPQNQASNLPSCRSPALMDPPRRSSRKKRPKIRRSTVYVPSPRNITPDLASRSTSPPDFNVVSKPELAPILTRPRKQDENCNPRKSVSRAAGGVRLRRRSRKRTEMFCNSDRFAIVKASVDPDRDFRESMMEMVVENNIRASSELEDLLACYLSLNSDQYHDAIIKAFQQIWFTLARTQRPHYNFSTAPSTM